MRKAKGAANTDPSTLLGLLVGWGAFVISLVWEGGTRSLGAFWNPPAFVLVAGGTVGATILSFPIERIRSLPAVLRNAFMAREEDWEGVIRALVGFAEKARREGEECGIHDAECADARFGTR